MITLAEQNIFFFLNTIPEEQKTFKYYTGTAVIMMMVFLYIEMS